MDNWFVKVLYKVCDYAGLLFRIMILVFIEYFFGDPIVGNFHRALVSRPSSGHRCFATHMFVGDSFTSPLDSCPRTMRSSFLILFKFLGF